MGKDSRCFLYVTDCHGPLSGVSWLCVLEQIQRQVGNGFTPAIEIPGVAWSHMPYKLPLRLRLGMQSMLLKIEPTMPSVLKGMAGWGPLPSITNATDTRESPCVCSLYFRNISGPKSYFVDCVEDHYLT